MQQVGDVHGSVRADQPVSVVQCGMRSDRVLPSPLHHRIARRIASMGIGEWHCFANGVAEER